MINLTKFIIRLLATFLLLISLMLKIIMSIMINDDLVPEEAISFRKIWKIPNT